MVEPQNPERVMRQFNLYQQVPPPPPSILECKFHEYGLNLKTRLCNIVIFKIIIILTCISGKATKGEIITIGCVPKNVGSMD